MKNQTSSSPNRRRVPAITRLESSKLPEGFLTDAVSVTNCLYMNSCWLIFELVY